MINNVFLYIKQNRNKCIFALILLLLITLFIRNFIIVINYSVDIPYLDELRVYFWEETGNLITPFFSLKYFFAPYYTHTIATTKFIGWIFYHINDLNFYWFSVFSYILYIPTLIALYLLCRRIDTKIESWKILLPIIFLLSHLTWETFIWATCFTTNNLGILFFLLSMLLLFRPTPKLSHTTLGGVSLFLSIISFPIGASYCSALIIFAILLFIKSDLNIKESLIHVGITLFFYIAGILIFLPPLLEYDFINLNYLFNFNFWDFFFNLLSFSFGFGTHSIAIGLLLFILILFPVLFYVLKNKFNYSSAILLTSFSAVLLTLFAISFNRSNPSYLTNFTSELISRSSLTSDFSKSSRFVHPIIILIPFVFISWSLLFRSSKLKIVSFLILFILLLIPFSDNWDHSQNIKSLSSLRKQGKMCVLNYYKKNNSEENVFCPELMPLPLIPIKPSLDSAKKLDVSFTRGF